MRGSFLRQCALALACLSFACGAPKPEAKSAPAYAVAGVLLPSSELGSPFVIQQRIHGQHQGREVTIDCVVQLDKGKLSVIGLTPFSTRAFVIEQVGTEVKLQKFVDRDVPFEPESVLYDLHRVFFRGLPSPQTNGTHEGNDRGDMVRERWENGHIVERRFQSLEGPTPQLVVVTFEGPPSPVIAPRVTITNVAFAYTLTIENLEQQRLDQNLTVEVEGEAPAQQP
jgi:hypothetical protein